MPNLFTGLWLLYGLLLLLDGVGAPWSRLTVVGLIAVIAGLLIAGSARMPQTPYRRSSPRTVAPSLRWLMHHWGDGMALISVVLFTSYAFNLNAESPDFIIHWGLKGRRFFESQGIDWAFLARPELDYAHPDYPNLLPSLFALQSLLAGRFSEPALMLWSPLFLGLLYLSVRNGLAASSPWIVQAGVATAIGAVSAFSIGYLQAGIADLLLTIPVLVGALLLQDFQQHPSSQEDALRRRCLDVGVVAAIGAALKVEGVALSAILLALFSWLHRRIVLRSPRMLSYLVVPTLVVVVPWQLRIAQHGLSQIIGVSLPKPERLPALWAGTVSVFGTPEWHGLVWLVLALPVLLLVAKTRLLGAVISFMLCFYCFAYVSSPPQDTQYWVVTSLPRLLLHIMPTLLVGLFLLLDKEGSANGLHSRASSRRASAEHPRYEDRHCVEESKA